MACTLRSGLRIEPVDDGYLVLRPDHGDVVHLTGDQAAALESARATAADPPAHLQVATAGLIELGIVESDTWSRRRILALGGAAAAAGVAVVALPGVAAAASQPTSTAPPTTSAPPPLNLPFEYLILAGGGAGGDFTVDNGGSPGGGGGGGGGVITGTATRWSGATTVGVGIGGRTDSISGRGGVSRIQGVAQASGGGRGADAFVAASHGDSGGGGAPANWEAGTVAGFGNVGGTAASQRFYVPAEQTYYTAYAGGGGGGRGSAGGNAVANADAAQGGDGGDGVYQPLAALLGIGVDGWVSGGGGGSAGTTWPTQTPVGGTGGVGGGGNGPTAGAGSTPGLDNTGGGGGAGSNGGSGAVIISYEIAAAGGRTITGGTVTDIGTRRYHVYTTPGTYTFDIG